jgi:micrococcal nuclease
LCNYSSIPLDEHFGLFNSCGPLSADGIHFNLPGLHPIIGERISIRVNGIDTPEIMGKCEKERYDAKQAQQTVEDISKDVE